jgi:hypothetical protein
MAEEEEISAEVTEEPVLVLSFFFFFSPSSNLCFIISAFKCFSIRPKAAFFLGSRIRGNTAHKQNDRERSSESLPKADWRI